MIVCPRAASMASSRMEHPTYKDRLLLTKHQMCPPFPLILQRIVNITNSAYKYARSVVLMSLVAGGSQWESAQLSKVGRSP